MPTKTAQYWLGILTTVITALIGVIAFFTVRLVNKVDDTQMQIYALREDVAMIKTKLDFLPPRMLDSKTTWKKISSSANSD